MPDDSYPHNIQSLPNDNGAVQAARRARKAQKRDDHDAALNHVVDAIVGTLGSAYAVDRSILITKLNHYFQRTALTSPEAMRSFPHADLADALREDPTLIGSKASIAAMLRAHETRNSQAAAKLRKTLSKDIPARAVVWRDGNYALEEATDPRHLQQDSATLKHCVGANPNAEAMAAEGIAPGDPREVLYLPYWMKISKGVSRIFTLTHTDVPLATIEFDTASKAITQIQGNTMTITGQEAFFPALCGALHSIKETLNLSGIQGLPHTPDNHILTRTGKMAVVTADNLADTLIGSLVLTEASVALLPTASHTRLITIDVTAISSAHLTSLDVVAGTIRSNTKEPFTLPALKSGAVHARFARTVSLPMHQSGNVDICSAKTVSLPEHRFGNMDVSSGQTVILPMHQSGNVYARSAQTVSLPKHQSGDVDANSAQTVILPEHQSGNVYASSAQTISLPKHQSGDVWDYSASR